MVERTEQRHDLKPNWLTADTAYGTACMAVGQNITPHIPVWERYPSSDGMFSRSEFTYAAEQDVYVCTNGKLLRTSGTVHDNRVRNYLSQPQDCRACTLKQRCTRAPFKKIARDINEDARNHARSLKGTPEFERSSNACKKIEMRFAHLKVQHGFERMRLRGLTGVRDEFHLAAIVHNLKTMAVRLVGPQQGEPLRRWRKRLARLSRCLPITLRRPAWNKPKNAPDRKKPATQRHFSTASVKLRSLTVRPAGLFSPRYCRNRATNENS